VCMYLSLSNIYIIVYICYSSSNNSNSSPMVDSSLPMVVLLSQAPPQILHHPATHPFQRHPHPHFTHLTFIMAATKLSLSVEHRILVELWKSMVSVDSVSNLVNPTIPHHRMSMDSLTFLIHLKLFYQTILIPHQI